MKRILCFFCVLCLTLPFAVSCSEETPAKRYDYDLDEYVTVPDPKAVKAVFSDPSVCSDEEIDEAIFQIMLSHASFAKKDGGAVEQYNKVKLSFSMEMDGEILEEYSKEDHEIIVGYDGSSAVESALGTALLGKTVGEEASAEYTYPLTAVELGSFAGKTVTVFGEVKEIYQHSIPECTDDFARQFEEEGITSVADLRAYLEGEILSGKQSAKEQAVLNAYLAGVEVKKYPEAEWKAYVDSYMKEIAAAAEQMEVSQEEYITVYLEMTPNEVKEAAENEAKNRVKNDLACVQGSRVMGTTLTEEEYKDGLENYFLNEGGDFASAEEFEAHYTKEILYESVLWDKTFQKMLETAIRLEPEK